LAVPRAAGEPARIGSAARRPEGGRAA